MKKYALSLLTLSMVFSSGFALADSPVGAPVERSVNLTFENPGILTHTLEAQPYLQAGNVAAYKVFANGSVTTTGENAGGVLFYFANSTTTVTTGQARINGTFVGNNPENTMSVSLEVPLGDVFFKDHNGTKGVGKTSDGNEYTYTLNNGVSPKNVVADTYTVKVVAQAWQP
jgi:hypothetical protein